MLVAPEGSQTLCLPIGSQGYHVIDQKTIQISEDTRKLESQFPQSLTNSKFWIYLKYNVGYQVRFEDLIFNKEFLVNAQR